MRKININEVGMENFGPYIDPMILQFENDKLTLMTGPNGIGKTMSLEAIPFTLYGETCKKARGDDVVNTRVGRNCHTWVHFTIDNDRYRVERYHKYTKLNNTVHIFKNDDEQPYKKGQREVVPEVEKLICSKKSFMNTLMFGQKVKDFFTDLVDSDKKEIFRKILDLDIYTTWYKEADNDLKAIKENLRQIVEAIGIESGILSDVENQILSLMESMKQFKIKRDENVAQLQKDLEENRRLVDGWIAEKDKFKDDETDLDSIIEKLADLDKQKFHHENEKNTQLMSLETMKSEKLAEFQDTGHQSKQTIIENSRKESAALQESHELEIGELASEENEIKQVMTDNRANLASITTEKRITQNDIDKLNESLEIEDGQCPTCLRDIDDACRKHLEGEVSDCLNSYKSLEVDENVLVIAQDKQQVLLTENATKKGQQIKAFQQLNNTAKTHERTLLEEVDEKVAVAFKKVNDLAGEQSEKITADYDEYINNLYTKIATLNEKKRVVEEKSKKLDSINSTIEALDEGKRTIEMKIKMEEEDEYDRSQLDSYEKRQIILTRKISELNKKSGVLKEDEILSTFWKAAWSPTGIPSMLIDEAIPFMNVKVSEYLDKLTNGRYIISFDTLAATKAGEFRDKISVNVLDTHTRANQRIQLSGGQTRIVDIATILTLGDLQANIQDVDINILLFDEIFDSLDEENIGFVSKILCELKIGKSIYLISHTQVEQLEADEVLELK